MLLFSIVQNVFPFLIKINNYLNKMALTEIIEQQKNKCLNNKWMKQGV